MTTYRAGLRRVLPPSGIREPQDAAWSAAEPLRIEHFRPEGSDHRPRTTLQLLHDDRAIHGLFRVEDRYVRCLHAAYGEPVYLDSCVEFFIQPKPGLGYFNFEFNCGGAFLCNYITDETRVPEGFKQAVRLTAEDVAPIQVLAALPKTVDPEMPGPVSWWLAFTIPAPVMERIVGSVGVLSGQVWRGNAFKCGSATSHPHWAAWAPVDQLNFHLPRCFGELEFL